MNPEGSPEGERIALLSAASRGDEAAAETLVRGSLALVRSIAKRYAGRAELEDLVQIGSLGLLKAIRGFDISRGVCLSTYAVPLIAGEIKRFLRDDGMIKVSRRLKEQAARIAAASRLMERETGSPPTVERLASALSMDPCEVAAALEAAAPCLSTDERLYGSESETTLGDTLPAEDSPENAAVQRVLVNQLLNALAPGERALIELRYFCNKTQKETALALGMTQAGVSRMEKRALNRMRINAGEE